MINQYDKDGNTHGPWELYYSNGQTMYKGEYKNGKFHGLWELYYDNGKLVYKGEHKNDKLRGLCHQARYSK